MKSIVALGAGVVLALAPTGTAFADTQPYGTGKGKAYGNCKHSSAGGKHDPLAGGAGKGNGGHVVGGKFVPCVVEQPPVKQAPVEQGFSTDGVDYSAGDEAPVG